MPLNETHRRLPACSHCSLQYLSGTRAIGVGLHPTIRISGGQHLAKAAGRPRQPRRS